MKKKGTRSRVTPEIRHAVPADYEAATRIFSGPRAVWGTLQTPYPSPELWRKRLSEPERGVTTLVACVEGEPVGMLGIHTHPDLPRVRHSGWLGMGVRDDWQGRGIGTALMTAAIDLADRWLGLSRLELDVYPDNDAAVKLYRKFGFEVEGTARKASLREGRLVDVLKMARLKP
jgi:putative acetyltransferase